MTADEPDSARRLAINVALGIAAVMVWTLLSLVTGRINVHDGLGFDGGEFSSMIRGFTLKGGDQATRVSPLFPALAWLPYALTGDVIRSLAVVNGLSIAVLVFAACVLMDGRRSETPWKVFVALNLTLAIAFSKVAAFVPGSAELCAMAALTLAVAACSASRPLVTAGTHVAAVMALPIGLVAPLYGVVRATRLRVSAARTAVMFAPAVLMWVFVQWWARGGVAGAVEDFTPHDLFGSTGVWLQPLFLAIAAYFLATSAGGLSIVALAQRHAWGQLARHSPEAIVLLCGVLAYAFVAAPAAPLVFGFLAPVWTLLCAEWSRTIDVRARWQWFAAGALLLLITQRPLAHMDLMSYFVDWHPYDVYRGSAPVQYGQLWEHWIPRFLVTAVAVWMMSLAARSRGAFVSGTAPPDDVLPGPASPEAPHRQARTARTFALTIARRWITPVAYVYAVLVAAAAAYFLFGLPIQLSDSFGNLLAIQSDSVWEVFKRQLSQSAYLRPLLHVQLKIVYELAAGNYFGWFRGLQALQVLAAALLTVRLLRPRRASDLMVVPCCLAMVLGLHTFAGAIREAFPINTFLTLVLCCLAAANLAQTRGGWLVEATAGMLLAFSLLTLETGVLVWVIFVAAYLAGYKGVSRRGLLVTTAVLAAYFVLRVTFLHVGAPAFDERSSGFGFAVLEPSELVARFSGNPLPLYLYNYASAVLTVLFAEPRGGVWQFVSGISQGSLQTWSVVNVLTSTLTTAALGWYVAGRARDWLRGSIADDDRPVLLFLAILPANALLCVVYVKDVVMSPAGVFYALAAAVALRECVQRATRMMPARTSIWTVAMLAVISAGWGWRLLGIHYSLRAAAADVRAEWAFEDEWEAASHTRINTPEGVSLKQTLLDDALWRRPAPPRLGLRWPEHAFDKTQ